MHDPILVTGGTGTLGSRVDERLNELGHDTRVLSRRPATGAERADSRVVADLLTGEGVPAAVDGAGTIVHCATTLNEGKEVRATETLLGAARNAGCPHLVYISIVGVDRVPFPYYRGKLRAERLIESSGIPHTILRATQFHDLVRVVFAATSKLPLMLVPGVSCQPVDTGEVASRLAELATGEPAGRAGDVAGPEVRECTDLARRFLARTGRSRTVVPVRLPGRTFAAYRAGGHLAPEYATGTVTFEQYLERHPNPARLPYRARGG